ncbi:MAG: heavy-metal-associated domain-containing protein [Planctomycetota bacterium]|nr:heavy-metal-associated domain-containing protein [Planctomycetota bacterium]MDA1211845.1 heavy-metal-associated domain-containing protein [Planctomycetota bacterium]
MKSLPIATAVLFLGLSASSLLAGDVTVKGVHLCCGACVDGVNEALTGVDGVSDVQVDRNTKVVAFKAADDDAAQRGVDALAKGGFFGSAKHGKKDIEFPESGAEEDAKSDKITLTGVHLCCGACVKDVQKTLQDVKGTTKIDVDREAGSVTLAGTGIVVTDAVAALNKGGFFGKVAE